MAIAGNRGGKTEIGVVYVLLQCVDLDCLPSWLKPYKFFAPPCKTRVVTMDLGSTLFGTMIPKFISLVPKDQLLGGKWDTAFEKSLRMLRFKNGSSVQFLSCDQDREKHSSADLDLVLFDEEPPPPNGYDIYRENRMRLIDRAGQMVFCMTPSLTSGGLSWSYDELYERRDEPGVDVIQWSMLDNPHLPREEVQREIADIRSEKERRARVYGDFVHFRGRVLEEFDADKHVVKVPSRDHIKGLDVIVGIDPGIARGGIVWVGFDSDNHALVFDELYPEGMNVPDIAKAIRLKNRWWNIAPDVYVIDPTSRNRNLTDGFQVDDAFRREGIPVIHGNNDRVAGILELKARLENHPALLVSEACVKWLFEQNRWLVAEDEATGKGDKYTTLGPDHLMDPCLIPGTMVETEYGSKPIEAVVAGDNVWTRDGLRMVEVSWLANPDAEVLTLTLADGTTLTGTGHHPVWADGKGWTRLSAIRYGDIVLSCAKPRSSSLRESVTTATPSPTAVPTAPTFVVPEETGSTGQSGVAIMAQSRQAAIFTTSTATPSTMPSRIWRASRRESIPSFISREFAISPATSAVWRSSLRHAILGPASVPTPASPRGGAPPALMTKTASAPSAARHGGPADFQEHALARLRAVSVLPTGRSPVYDLQVEGSPEFFANGILTHNTRYACLFRPYGNMREDKHPIKRGYLPTFDPELAEKWEPSRPQEQSPMGAFS